MAISSRIEPPGWMIAVTPAWAAIWMPSGKGKYASAAMTVLVLAYCAPQLSLHSRFVPAFVVTLVILLAGGVAAWTLRRGALWTYAPALLAMTATSAANTAMTVLVILSHAPRSVGCVFGAVVTAGQVVAGTVVYFQWRREVSVP